jgi:hypothetical protein
MLISILRAMTETSSITKLNEIKIVCCILAVQYYRKRYGQKKKSIVLCCNDVVK